MNKYRKLPSQEFLQECFDYNPETGVLIWKEKPRELFNTDSGWIKSNKQTSGKLITSTNNKGYIVGILNGSYFAMHRVIWKLMTGDEPKFEIDHVNNIRNDNRWCNLREANLFENKYNQSLRTDNTSGTKGVHWNIGNKAWVGRVRYNGKRYLVCQNQSKEYVEAEVIKFRNDLHGQFANHGDVKFRDVNPNSTV
jgi:hypothetical protein